MQTSTVTKINAAVDLRDLQYDENFQNNRSRIQGSVRVF